MKEILQRTLSMHAGKVMVCDLCAVTILNFGAEEPLLGAEPAKGGVCSQLSSQGDC